MSQKKKKRGKCTLNHFSKNVAINMKAGDNKSIGSSLRKGIPEDIKYNSASILRRRTC